MVPISGNHLHAFQTIWPLYLRANMQPYPLQKICNIIFQKWGGGVKGRLEFFRKVIRFGTATRPLSLTHYVSQYELSIQVPSHILHWSWSSLRSHPTQIPTKHFRSIWINSSPKSARFSASLSTLSLPRVNWRSNWQPAQISHRHTDAVALLRQNSAFCLSLSPAL